MGTDLRLIRSARTNGSYPHLRRIFSTVFPGIKFWGERGGLEKLRYADKNKIKLPAVIRKVLRKLPPLEKAALVSDGYSLDITLGAVGCRSVKFIDLTFRGNWEAASAKFLELEQQFGWMIDEPTFEEHLKGKAETKKRPPRKRAK